MDRKEEMKMHLSNGLSSADFEGLPMGAALRSYEVYGKLIDSLSFDQMVYVGEELAKREREETLSRRAVHLSEALEILAYVRKSIDPRVESTKELHNWLEKFFHKVGAA